MNETPRTHGMLSVGDNQTIYWEEWGSPDGVPALYLHGGLGGTLGSSEYRHRFDLTRTRVIGFEQRGCGRSLPHASNPSTSSDVNTTAHLIEDIESLRQARDVDTWILNGVSWGSTLALSYAQAHPGRVAGIVLFAVTTTSRQEVDWVTESIGKIFPESWNRFATFAEQSRTGFSPGQGRIVEAYAQLLNSPDPKILDAASREWALWEDTHVSTGAGRFTRDPRWNNDVFRLAFARLTTHYWAHDGFNTPPLLDRMDRICHLPGILIHGRQDISGPAVTAWELHRAWPGSILIIDEGEGHGGATMVEHWNHANAALVASQLG